LELVQSNPSSLFIAGIDKFFGSIVILLVVFGDYVSYIVSSIAGNLYYYLKMLTINVTSTFTLAFSWQSIRSELMTLVINELMLCEIAKQDVKEKWK
jgi:hypothetical protein